jgi:hypothetical protein
MVLLSKVPNMTIFAPSSYQELRQMLHDALEITDGPVAIRYPKTPAPDVGEDEIGVGLRPARCAPATDVCGARPSARCSPPHRSRRDPGRRGHLGHGVRPAA